MICIDDKEFSLLSNYIKQRFGIKLGAEKKSLIMGRLYKVMEEKQFKSFSEYYDYLVADKTGGTDIQLVNMITTNHTFFMREVAHFHYFRNQVLPGLNQSVRDKDLRVWSAGCSFGKEAYTLAMIMDEYFGTEKFSWDCKLLATDISERALGVAVQGVYSQEEIAPLPKHWQMNYFDKIDKDKCVISEKIKKEVIFRKLNLMDKVFPFKKKFHVIYCRNVMIYFDDKTRRELVDKFYDLTEDNGYLFIGHSESLNRETTGYKYVKPAIYRKER